MLSCCPQDNNLVTSTYVEPMPIILCIMANEMNFA